MVGGGQLDMEIENFEHWLLEAWRERSQMGMLSVLGSFS